MRHLMAVVSACLLLAGSWSGRASAETAPVLVLKWGTDGTGVGPFGFAQGIAVDASGYVYLTDGANKCVKKFDANGNFVSQIGSVGLGPGQFLSINSVTVDASGNIYVTEGAHVKKFDSGGNYVTQWGVGPPNGTSTSADAIDVGPDNSIYVSEPGKRIQRFTPDGQFISDFAVNTANPIPFGVIEGLTVTPTGMVYAADRQGARIEVFDTTGVYQSQWSVQTGNGGPNQPGGPHQPNAVDNWGGRLYVTDEANRRIQMFDEAGAFLVEWYAYGDGGDQESAPRGVAVGPSGDVYVLFHYQVQKFSYAPVAATPSSWGAIKAHYR